MNYTLSAETGHLNLTPYVTALMSRDLHSASNALIVDDRHPVANFLLYAMSVELGLKAAVLNFDNSAAMKKRLKDEVGHDLICAYNIFFGVTNDKLFDAQDIQAFEKLNPYYKGKGLEYFTPDMLVAALQAFSGFPPLGTIKAASQKVDAYLTERSHFLE